MAYIGKSPETDSAVKKYEYTATSGQTTFSASYETRVDVYLNGVKLRNGTDVFVTYGNKIVFDSNIGTTGTDELDIIAYNTFEIANITTANITSGTLAYARGGTGLGTLGSAGQALIVNDSGNAIVWGDVATDLTGTLTSSDFASPSTLNIKNSAGTNLKTIIGVSS